MTDKVLPGWLAECVQDARRLLGVGDDWHISLKMVDHPDGDPDNNAAVYPDGAYLNARLELAWDLANDEEGQRVVMHEVLHIGHTEVDLVVKQILAGLPERERGRFNELYDDAVERFLQRTTRAMVRYIRPTETKEGDGDGEGTW